MDPCVVFFISAGLALLQGRFLEAWAYKTGRMPFMRGLAVTLPCPHLPVTSVSPTGLGSERGGCWMVYFPSSSLSSPPPYWTVCISQDDCNSQALLFFQRDAA